MRLSLCIATYNEENFIHYPLDSAYDLVDEVVIVDGGSTDRTVKIAKSYGEKVKVFTEDNPKMFHINKQKAIERAKGEWILQLDADEALSPGLKKEIKTIVSGHPDPGSPPVAYYIPRKNFFLNRFLEKGGQYPDYTIRLYGNGYARFPCQDVHENVEISQKPKINSGNHRLRVKSEKKSDLTKEGSNSDLIGYLKNPILHYADPDFSRYLKRWDRYTTLAVQSLELKVKNKKKNLFFMFLEYFFWKPAATFFSMYFRHRGFQDGFPGFVFALFSSIRFWVIYVKAWHKLAES